MVALICCEQAKSATLVNVPVSYTITRESLESLASYWVDSNQGLRWSSVFVLPVWLQVWWQEFGSGVELYLGAIKQGETVIGIAPLLVKERTASIIGSDDVCDYLDFIVLPGREEDFFNILLDDLKGRGIDCLDLGALRPDSTVLTSLVGIARKRGYEVLCQPEDVSVELTLPPSWEEYLMVLTTKQRHEVRRKLRRLDEAGKVDYQMITERAAVTEAMGIFLQMFTESREDKAAFLTERRESFFKSLVNIMAGSGRLRLGILKLDSMPVAAVMCFDYNDCLYLYNSGYNPRYSSLSAGLLCKVLCIKESIQEGKKRFDFLKGNEAYKYHLGGREVPLSRCQVVIK